MLDTPSPSYGRWRRRVRWSTAPAAGSQFRSRDLFPQAAASIALGRPEALAEAIHPTDIPEVPAQRIAYIDGYGNLKTTILFHANAMAPGTIVRVRIGQAEQRALISDGSFAVEPGQLALAPGSSGWPYPQGSETRWMETLLAGRQCLGGVRAAANWGSHEAHPQRPPVIRLAEKTSHP